jgi:hypothetical protein
MRAQRQPSAASTGIIPNGLAAHALEAEQTALSGARGMRTGMLRRVPSARRLAFSARGRALGRLGRLRSSAGSGWCATDTARRGSASRGDPAPVSAAGDGVAVSAGDRSAAASPASSLVPTMVPFAPTSSQAGAAVSPGESTLSGRPAGMGVASGVPLGRPGTAVRASSAGSCAGFAVPSAGFVDPPASASPDWEPGSSAAGGPTAGSEESVGAPDGLGDSVPGWTGTPAGPVGGAPSASGIVCPAEAV